MNLIINDQINLEGKRIIEHGISGIVFDMGDGTCFKYIYNHLTTNKDDNGLILSTISNLKLHNFCQILKIFYDEMGFVIGYLMTLYKESNLDILSLPTSYVLNSYQALYNGIIEISNQNIVMEDFDSHSVLITNEGIIAYDFDSYYKGRTSESTLIRNIVKLNITFNQLFKEERLYKHSFQDPRLLDRNTDLLFNSRTNPDLLSKMLCKYKRPINFLSVEHEKTK